MTSGTRTIRIDRAPETGLRRDRRSCPRAGVAPRCEGLRADRPARRRHGDPAAHRRNRGRQFPADIRITAYERPVRYAFEAIAGPVRPAGEYRLTAASGGTDLTFTLAAEPRGVKALLLGRLVRGSIDDEMRNMDGLKALLERS